MYGVDQPSKRRRGCLIIVGLLVLVLVLAAIFAAFYFLLIKDKDETPAPTPTFIIAATDTLEAISPATPTMPSPPPTQAPPTPSATRVPPTATATPSPTATPLPPPETITIGVRAMITTTVANPINLRNLPSLGNSTVITSLVGGAPLDVTDGPTDADNLRWWNVRASGGITGWMVEAVGGTTVLVPVDWTSQATPLPTAEPTPEPTVEATAAPTVEATQEVTATATLEPTPEVTATATLEPTEEVTATVTPTPGPGTPTPIPSPTVGGRVRINVPEYGYLNLRQDPGLGGEAIGQLEDGTIVKVVDGPQEVDDLTWWKVENDEGLVGWAAERRGNEVWMIPVE